MVNRPTANRLAAVRRRTRPADRRGTSAVELAAVLPLLMLLIVGAIDVGRGLMVQHDLVTAARAACRVYSVKTKYASSDVQSIVKQSLTDTEIKKYDVVLEPTNADTIAYLDPVTVTVAVDFDEVAWLPGAWFMAGRRLAGKCTMPADPAKKP